MTAESMFTLVKQNLGIVQTTNDQIIKDIIQLAGNYCNITDYPTEMEPVIRRKAKQIINYESEFGANTSVDVETVKSGDTSITYKMDKGSAYDTIYNLTDVDKTSLRPFRKVRR